MESLPDDVLALILKYLPRDGTNSRINAILTCKRWNNVYLTKVLPPWKIFLIDHDRTDYCGLMGAFDVNANTINKEYFFHWYEKFPKALKKDFLFKYGDYFFYESCALDNKEDRKEMVKFFLKEFMDYFSQTQSDGRSLRDDGFTYEQISTMLSSGISHILFKEDIDLAYIIFIDYCFIPISKKILKKWCTILCHKREYPDEKILQKNRVQLVKWIKHRPEMTKYLIRGEDNFYY